MQPILPSTLEAVLLYKAMPRYEPRNLLALINEFSAQYGYGFNWLPSDDTENVIQFSDDVLGIEIVHTAAPLPAAGFEHSLNSGFTKWKFPDAATVIESHQQHVYITVGVLDQQNADEEGFDPGQFRFAISLLKALVMMYMSRGLPSAIHWVQSDKLLTNRQFAEIALDEKDISLLVHPDLSWSGETGANNLPMVKFRTTGAKTLIGREIIFNDTPAEPAHLYERSLQLIRKMLETGLIIPDGDTFGVDESEEILVNHLKEDEAGDIMQLSILRSEQFDIISDDDSQDQHHEEVEHDADDPVERALQEKISELRAREQKLLESESADRPATEGLPTQEPWHGVTRKTDLSALRALTRPVNNREVHAPPMAPEHMDERVKDLNAARERAASGNGTVDTAAVVDVEAPKRKPLMTRVSGLLGRR